MATTSNSLSPLFQAGGLASGLDTNSIIDSMVQAESQRLSQMKTEQSAFQTQISTLGDLTSKLSALEQAAQDLGSGGVVGVTAQTVNDSFTATPGAGATAGRYSVQVDRLAQGAKSRSQAFGDSTSEVSGGTLQLTVMGKTYDPITIDDGESLADVATAINQLGAPISAVVLNDGKNNYLSISNTQTGYPLDGSADDALSVVETTTGTQGQPLNLEGTQPAVNAQITVDGLTFTRQSNAIGDVIPGTTLALQSEGGPAENLVLANDPAATQAKLQKFVDSYNAVIQLVQKQLDVSQSTDRSSSLAGDSAVRDLQTRMQQMIGHLGSGSDVRSLADLGVKTARDGTLSIDANVLSSALSRNPGAVNTLFTDQADGLSRLTTSLVESEVDPTQGLLALDSQGLQDRVKSLDDDQVAEQKRLDDFRARLVAQFTAMEQIVSQLKSIGTFLTQQDQARQLNAKNS